jgi:rod shape-determining protein MreD
MRRFTDVLVAVLAAVLFYAFVGRISPTLLLVVNAFSLVVVYFSISRGEVFGAVIGTICGLIQDSFSSGVFGLAGLTKTLLGYGTGFISRRIDVTSFWRKAAFVLVMTSLELAAWLGLKSLIFSERVYLGRGLLLLQPPVAALAVGLLFAVLKRFKKRSP